MSHTSRTPAAAGRPKRRAGFSAIELLAAMTLLGILVAISAPGITDFYLRYQLNAAVSMFQNLIQEVRMTALKEKKSYRLLIRDAASRSPNRIEVQREEGGRFRLVPGRIHRVPSVVRISPGSAPDLIVNEQGECVTRTVQFAIENGSASLIKVQPTCASYVR